MPSPCRLRSLFRAPGVTITGYDADGVHDVGERGIVIGRITSADITIDAMIGGRNTYRVLWYERGWTLRVMNEWAIAQVNGERLEGLFPSYLLRDADTIELLAVNGGIVHRFRVELGQTHPQPCRDVS